MRQKKDGCPMKAPPVSELPCGPREERLSHHAHFSGWLEISIRLRIAKNTSRRPNLAGHWNLSLNKQLSSMVPWTFHIPSRWYIFSPTQPSFYRQGILIWRCHILRRLSHRISKSNRWGSWEVWTDAKNTSLAKLSRSARICNRWLEPFG